MTEEIVRFCKLRSATDPNFWAKFAELKIDKYKLDDKIKISLWGSYSLNFFPDGKTTPLMLDCTSFNENVDTTSHNNGVACVGFLVNTNTYDSFRQINPQNFIDSVGEYISEAIKDGTALIQPWKLTLFLVISFADLKKYRFHYWVAYPTSFNIPEMYYKEPAQPATLRFDASQIEKLQKGFMALHSQCKCFFAILVSEKDNLEVISLAKGVDYVKSNAKENNEEALVHEEVYFAIYDPCISSEPGWPMRNLLCLLCWHCPTFYFEQDIKILSMRGYNAKRAIVYTLKAKEYPNKETIQKAIFDGRFVGWEANSNRKMGPNIADLSDTMDPVKLSGRAVDLNLKLMKWRLVPDLDLDGISKLRCLLLGAGTLGCAVARVLLGWAVGNITFVDSSVVSHSNPVRQSLYTHQDAVQRRYKVHAAKDALLQIRPNMNVDGVVLHIPMPGHVVGQSMMETTQKAIKKLEELVVQHDVVFLLLDSREARWLPTLLCAAHNKIAINAALGFDSYTVQRHGTRNLSNPVSPDLTLQNPTGQDLGCYFCNDVTQPGNSQIDRTLDQQCTVSRPGLAQIAAALAVELMIALTQHPKRAEARALMDSSRDSYSNKEITEEGLLGGLPHTIRGSLWSHEMRLTITHRFSSCTACSTPLINEYRSRGSDFILDACNQPNYLERLAGLEELLKRPDLDELCYAIDSSSEDEKENLTKTST
ncbi:ubiquitin-like modifier-activating enzyme atg7 [Cephus cinctus]|uniref:Ubiquitin-like modifier-activating enzyme ATG7 n=1 Tax=Cephus cinctus TaxID=211228 RepID=A0AAJ7RN79_CEPCN|nr:ubiquitin-like modifier-activating enzyme atg7 [Cephus cinctus]XP_024944051.1 ubiquitin-like modifier-activating enzyme atg7 [Cephus cinctus]